MKGMGWLIFAAILGIILLLRFGVDVVYKSGILTVRAQLNFIYFTVYSTAGKKKRKKKKPKKEKKKKPAEQSADQPAQTKKQKMSMRQIMDLVGCVSKAVKRVLKGVRVDHLEAQITLAGDDPAKLALLYGELCSASGTIHVLLDNLINLKHYSVLFEPDFCSAKTRADVRVHITLTNFAVICAVFGFIGAFLRYLKKYKKPKAGGQGQNERREEASGQRDNGPDNGEDQADGGR